MLYALNLYNVICQLYLNKTEKMFLNTSDHCRVEIVIGVDAEQLIRNATEGTPPFTTV